MKFLVVEDEYISRRHLTNLLSQLGKCDASINGEAAINSFKKSLEKNEPYDLICLDIMMPVMDGHQALERIRDIEREKGIEGDDRVKVIMTTSMDDNQNKLKSFRNKADKYIQKPIDNKKLLAMIRSLGLLE